MINGTEHVTARNNSAWNNGVQQQRYGDRTAQQLPRAQPARTKPVRRSVDLPPTQHARLTQPRSTEECQVLIVS